MASAFILLISIVGCNKSESYSNLLRTEEHSVNSFLATQDVRVKVPADSVLIYGDDAPFYKMNEDGTIYMKIINPGNLQKRAKYGDRVYFRFSCKNLNQWAAGYDPAWEGNSNNLNSSFGNTSFIYGNSILESSYKYGTGIQLPMKFVGDESEVYLVLKASSGFVSEQSSCTPYLFHIRYFKAEY